MEEHSLAPAGSDLPAESSFVVPCTSLESHSEQAISQKAFTLLRLSRLGYPVPEFVVVTAQAYEDRFNLETHLAEAITALEVLTAQSFAPGRQPLVFALRCATGHYIPGVMDTYLNVGVTDRTLPQLERMYGTFPTRKMFLNNLRNLCLLLYPDRYAGIANAVRADLSREKTDAFVEQLSEILTKADPNLLEDPYAQALFFAKQAYQHFEQNQELVVTFRRDDYPTDVE